LRQSGGHTSPSDALRLARQQGFAIAVLRGYPESMTHDEAMATAKRRQALDPDVTWIAARRGGEWTVARVGMAPPTKPTGTATKPPPVGPRDDPSAVLQRGGY
jgi:hypothetical protein